MNKCRQYLNELQAESDNIYGDSRKAELPSAAWPGGYTVVYYCRDSSTVCATCATAALDRTSDDYDPQYEPIDYGTFDEGMPMQCESCQIWLISSYGPTDDDNSRDGMTEPEYDAYVETLYADNLTRLGRRV